MRAAAIRVGLICAVVACAAVGSVMPAAAVSDRTHLVTVANGGWMATDGEWVVWSQFRAASGNAAQHDRPQTPLPPMPESDLYGMNLDDRQLIPIATSPEGDRRGYAIEQGILTWVDPIEYTGEYALHAVQITDFLAPVDPPPPGSADPDWDYFSETGHYLHDGFGEFWAANGGLPVFGYPLTEEYREQSLDTGDFATVQYVERQRFEYHPENTGTPYEVELGRLGAELLERQHREWFRLPKGDPSAPQYFAETSHAIAPEFWDYWSSHGLEFGDDGVSFAESLALFGYPISEPMLETNLDGDTVLTQYFERAVFEWHPDNPDPYKVLLRRVGAEELAARVRDDWPPAFEGPGLTIELLAPVIGATPGPPLALELAVGDRSHFLLLDEVDSILPPENGACHFTELVTRVTQLLSESPLRLQGVDDTGFDVERGRWELDGVDRIWVGDALFSETLLREGYATLDPDQLDSQYQNQLVAAEQHARANGVGLWGACR